VRKSLALTAERLRRAYFTVAAQWLTATILFVLFTIATAVLFVVLDRRADRKMLDGRNPDALKKLSPAQARAVFADTARIPEGNSPWVGYCEREFHSATVNVDASDPLPIRRTPPVEAAKTIWLFGGSSAFGYGVPDNDTLAAHLQQLLPVRVINHGHLGWYSSQEELLFEWLLRGGKRADVAVFLDGFNDSRYRDDVPDGDAAPQPEQRMIQVSPEFPPVRFVRTVLRKLARRAAPATWPPTRSDDIARLATNTARRYEANVQLGRAAASTAGIRTLFVWQPTPFEAIHAPPDDPAVKRVFAVMARNPVIEPANALVRQRMQGDDFVDLSRLFANDRFGDVYVDSCHYGDVASAKLAAAIAAEITRRRLLQ